MAVRDLEAFIRQRAALFDANLDLNPGSPFDVQVIQPMLRRLGTDPFSVDLSTFINDRVNQAFPELATTEGDAITDLLNKPVTLLWDPIVREIRRIGRQQSFVDPTTLTLDEAEALGSNLFSERQTGEFARGVARIFFASPQTVAVSPVNFVTSKTGLHFFPTETQSIRTEEMLLNLSADGLYYFDINVIAEEEGTQFNIGANELTSIANISAAVRLQNTRRFSQGVEQETAVQFVGRARQELTEKSLVTLRGIGAKVTRALGEVRRLNVVGFNDPEMNRDIIKGGGLGSLVSSGNGGSIVNDGVGGAFSRRFSTSEVSFITLIGSPGPAPSGFVLTVFDAYGATDDVREFDVITIISATEIEVEDQVFDFNTTAGSVRWTLRKRELTLSDIPGGILFPDSANGSVTIQDDEIHIGGTTDVHIRGAQFEESTLVLDAVVDDEPLLNGLLLSSITTTTISLGDFVLDSNYSVDDTTFLALERADREGLSLQILAGPNAGVFRVVLVVQATGLSPVVTVTPAVTVAPSGPVRWRLVDELNIDLVDPKETRISDSDLETIQGSDLITTTVGTDFDELGVAKDDILRILTGPDAGDLTIVAAPIAPLFTTLQVESELQFTKTGLSYIIFRPNDTGGINRPLVRVTSVEVLDGSDQPQGTTIPYKNPIDIQSRAFQNPARGVKHDLSDVRLGIVSLQSDATDSYVGVPAGGTLIFSDLQTVPTTTTVVLTGGTMARATVIAEINAVFAPIVEAAVNVGTDRLGIRPLGPDGRFALIGGTANGVLFGVNAVSSGPMIHTSADIRSAEVDLDGGWGALDPFIDFNSGLDVFQAIDGNQIGFFPAPYTINYINATISPLVDLSEAVIVGGGNEQGTNPFTTYSAFAPEANVRMQVGARSIGSVRCFFLEPTSIEFDRDSFFSVTVDAGTLRFIPDPTLGTQKIPPLPDGTTPTDGSAVKTSVDGVFTSLSQDLELSGILPSDELIIEHFPLGGTVVLTDPVSDLVSKTFIYSLDNQPDRTLTFIKDDASLAADEVSRQGIVDQINSSAGATICQLTSGDELEFETNFDLVIRTTGTAVPLILGNIFGTTPAISFAAASATGLITTVNQSFYTDGQTFDLDDGVNPATTFEFDTVPDGVGGGNIVVDISALITAVQVRDAIIAAINGVGAGLLVTASPGNDTDEAVLTNGATGSVGNVAITTSGSPPGTYTGMTGGIGDIVGNATQRSNRAPHFGNHEILIVTPTTMTVAVADLIASGDYANYPATIERQSFRIERPGQQRIVTSTMEDNEAESDLFFFDVELVSEGTGDLWNIDAALQMGVTGFRSDGYELTTDDSNLTFSEVEELKIIISRSILESGVDDDPSNATQITGQNLQITYDRSPTVSDTQGFISSEIERVICSSPLSRHLIPHFVRFDLTYAGGSTVDLVVEDLTTLITDLFPNDLLEVSDIEKTVSDRGATSITNPIDLIAVVHNVDRSVTAQRSQNALGVGRLNTFIVDVLNITRNVAGS